MKVNPANSISSIENDKIKKYEVNNDAVKSSNIPKNPTKENSLNDTINNKHENNKNINGIVLLSEIQKTNNNKYTDNDVYQNLNKKFNEVAGEPSMRDTRSKEDFPLQMKSYKDLKDQRFESNLRSPMTNEIASASKDKVSVREGVDFTFKKSFVDNRSEINVISYNKVFSSPNKFNSCNSNNEAIEYSNSKDNFKQSVTSFSRAFVDKENEEKVFSGKEKDIKKNNTVSFNNQNLTASDKLIKLTPINVYAEENIILDDEFVPSEEDFSENQSVISSKILSHVNTPKMIGGIKSSSDQSYNNSSYSKSEFRESFDTTNNNLYTDLNMVIPHFPDDTEYEITNENSDRFGRFIETPKSSNLFFNNYPINERGMKNSISLHTLQNNTLSHSNSINPKLKDLHEKYNKKEKETKKLNEKIQKIVNEIHKLEEDTKRYERKIEKEESDGEMLKHMLNFLMSNA